MTDLLRYCFIQGKLYEESIVVFVIATTGQGDPPDTAKVCLKLLILKTCICCTSNDIRLRNLYIISGFLEIFVTAKLTIRLVKSIAICSFWTW